MGKSIMSKATKDYIKRIEELAASIEVEMNSNLEELTLQTSPDTVIQLPYLQLTTAEMHILVKSLCPVSFYHLHNCLIEKKAPITDMKALAGICAKLVARKHLTISYVTKNTPKLPQNYTGTLTVMPDGTITFMPDNTSYQSAIGIPLLTIMTDCNDIPPFRPIVISGKAMHI